MVKNVLQCNLALSIKFASTKSGCRTPSGFGDSAFTLLEILVAVMIFGIIMLTVFSSFRSFMTSSYMIKRDMAASEITTSVADIMVRDLLSLRISLPPEYSGDVSGEIGSASGKRASGATIPDSKPPFSGFAEDDGRDKFRFSGDETVLEGDIFSRLRFASLAHISFGSDARTIDSDKDGEASSLSEKVPVEKSMSVAERPGTEAGVARIIYYVRPSLEDGFELCRSDTLNRFDDTDGSDCDPVICRNITKFKITYMDIKGDEHSEWDSDSNSSGYATPVSLSIDMEFRVMDSLRTLSTHISMPLFRPPVKSD